MSLAGLTGPRATVVAATLEAIFTQRGRADLVLALEPVMPGNA